MELTQKHKDYLEQIKKEHPEIQQAINQIKEFPWGCAIIPKDRMIELCFVLPLLGEDKLFDQVMSIMVKVHGPVFIAELLKYTTLRSHGKEGMEINVGLN